MIVALGIPEDEPLPFLQEQPAGATSNAPAAEDANNVQPNNSSEQVVELNSQSVAAASESTNVVPSTVNASTN